MGWENRIYGLGDVDIRLGRSGYTTWEKRIYDLGEEDIRLGRSGYTTWEEWKCLMGG